MLDCEATCGPSACGIYFNTNLTNLSICAGLTSNKETIRFVFKETTHTAVPHVDLLSRVTWVVTRNVKSELFSRENFWYLLYFRPRKNLYIVDSCTDKAKKISAKAFRKSAKAYRIFYFRCISSFKMGQKKRKEPRVSGSFLFASTKIIHFRAKCKSL